MIFNRLLAAGTWLISHFIMLVTFVYNIVRGAVLKLISILNDSKEPGAPWSLRRILAAFFAWLFYKALMGVMAAFALPNPPDLPVVIVVLAAPLLGVIFLLFFTTWESVRGVIDSIRGNTSTVTGTPEQIMGTADGSGGK